jgi:hypothetical protein
VLLVREFREVLAVVEEAIQEMSAECDILEKINIAYMAFYYGTGPNSDRVLSENLKGHDSILTTALANKLSEENRKLRVKSERNFAFVPFEGHQSRLGHYYRHLYRTVQYINANLGISAGMQYADLLRAKLSNHE